MTRLEIEQFYGEYINTVEEEYLDAGIIGVAFVDGTPRAVYDCAKTVKTIIEHTGMSFDDALHHFRKQVYVPAQLVKNGPIFVNTL